ncbi:MAG TPA: WXG100 family type VII secretion target [Actinocatenispora sp.]
MGDATKMRVNKSQLAHAIKTFENHHQALASAAQQVVGTVEPVLNVWSGEGAIAATSTHMDVQDTCNRLMNALNLLQTAVAKAHNSYSTHDVNVAQEHRKVAAQAASGPKLNWS